VWIWVCAVCVVCAFCRAGASAEGEVRKSKNKGPFIQGLQMLLEAKADVNHRTRGDKAGHSTALHFAYEHNNQEVGGRGGGGMSGGAV
jgi:hypothetical protein